MVGRREHLGDGVGHRHAVAGHTDHRQVVVPVAERDRVRNVDAQMAAQPRERGALMGFFVGNLDV